MQVKNVRIFYYQLNLKTDYAVANVNLSAKQGYLIEFESQSGVKAYGDIAPLAGRSEMNFNATGQQLLQMKTKIPQEEISDDVIRLDGAFEKWLGKYQLSPAVRFGIECAVLNLFANSKNVPLNELVSQNCDSDVAITGLLCGSQEQVIKETKKLLKQGYSTFKLKVSDSFSQDAETIARINDLMFDRAILHLDANQKWTIEQAIDFGNTIGCAAVNYIEEPLKTTSDITKFFEETLIPVALDETLQDLNYDKIPSIDGVDFFVLKPSLIGSMDATWRLIQDAQNAAIIPVISSSFESSIGIHTLASIASCLKHDRPAGLDTLKWFEQDLLKDPLTINRGRMMLSDRRMTSEQINFNLLTELT